MRRDQFAASQWPHVRHTEGGYLAFTPPPLPPELALDRDLVGQTSRADRALGLLSGVGQTLPNPYLLSQTLMRREAVLSSRIEGTQASLSDLVLFEVEQQRPRVEDVREVANYLRAMEHVLDPGRRLPLSLSLLREAHELLLSDVRGDHATPGEFRRSQNWIGTPGCTLDEATYVPPAPERLWEALDAFEKYLHSPHDLPPLIVVALAHYQFEAIHPFTDGNGRVGRLLISLLLVEWGLLPMPLLDLSAYFESRRDTYYATLLRVSTHGEWHSWIGFFLTATEAQATEAVARARRLQQLRADYRAHVATARSSALLGTLVDALFQTPAVSVRRAQEILGVTHRAASNNVEKLVDEGILTEATGRQRDRVYLATEIVRLLEGSTE